VVTTILITLKLFFQNIWKKEELENGKHDKQFDQNDPPEPPPPGHGSEPIIVKPEYPFDHYFLIEVQII
jgi:hypothetical protein